MPFDLKRMAYGGFKFLVDERESAFPWFSRAGA